MNLKELFSSLSEKVIPIWEKANEKQKRGAIIGVLATAFLSTGYLIHKSRVEVRETVIEERQTEEQPEKLTLKKKWLDKNDLEKSQAENAKLKNALKEKELETEAVKKEVKDSLKSFEEKLREEYKLGSPGSKNNQQAKKMSSRYPQVPNKTNTSSRRDKAGSYIQGKDNKPALYGGIGRVRAPKDTAGIKGEEEGLNSEKGTYLPVSFMEATMLSGVDAPVMSGGKANPVPVLLMIKSLAFLPNDVRKDLKGCFIIAEGYGNLSNNRIKLLTDVLSCVKKDGSSFIEEKIKGFIVDSEDNKLGIKGRPVAKFESAIARVILSGAFEGGGEVLSQSAATSTTLPTGETQNTVDQSQVQSAMIGSGLSKAATKMSEFYMTLAEQMLPSMESPAKADVVVVLREGVFLNYRSSIQ